MPAINRYKCNKCNFELMGGWGGYMYVRNKKNERIRCKHPIEWSTVYEELGIIRGLIQQYTCPDCKSGRIIEVVTGIVT